MWRRLANKRKETVAKRKMINVSPGIGITKNNLKKIGPFSENWRNFLKIIFLQMRQLKVITS